MSDRALINWLYAGLVIGLTVGGYIGLLGGMILHQWKEHLPERIRAWVEEKIS